MRVCRASSSMPEIDSSHGAGKTWEEQEACEAALFEVRFYVPDP